MIFTKFSYNPSDKDIISISMYNGEDNLDSFRKNNNTFGSNTDGERSITTDIKDLLNKLGFKYSLGKTME